MRNPTLAAAIAITAYIISNPQPLLAQQPQLTVRVIATVDYPGSGNSTTVQGINDLGDVTGYFEDGSGAIRSFIRYADGAFSEPIVEPNDDGNLTVAKDIDNTGRICGYYYSSLSPYLPYLGFFLSGTTFTEYGGGEGNWFISGLTDEGDFCGTYSFIPKELECFLVLADGAGPARILNSTWTINNNSECNAIGAHTGTVGDYKGDSDSGWHGFIRDKESLSSRILAPIDYPGATDTFFYGVNDGGRIIVGKYVDTAGATHGLIFQRPDSWSSFDYPGAVETSFNGISNNKIVSGYYTDRSGIHHGFIGKVHQAP